VNQRYVIATSTQVPLTGVDVSAIDDAFFAREQGAKKEFFDTEKTTTTTSDARKAAQQSVDEKLSANISKIEFLNAYLGARFTLSKGDRPHLMQF
jgi:large subunit ribosomal protein L6e